MFQATPQTLPCDKVTLTMRVSIYTLIQGQYVVSTGDCYDVMGTMQLWAEFTQIHTSKSCFNVELVLLFSILHFLFFIFFHIFFEVVWMWHSRVESCQWFHHILLFVCVSSCCSGVRRTIWYTATLLQHVVSGPWRTLWWVTCSMTSSGVGWRREIEVHSTPPCGHKNIFSFIWVRPGLISGYIFSCVQACLGY